MLYNYDVYKGKLHMKIISGTTEFRISVPTAVAVGKFDGIHKGHQKLLEEIIAHKKLGLATCCFTFEPSPGIFFGSADKGELTTREEKRRLFAFYKEIDYMVEFPLTKATAALAPIDFVTTVLREKLQTRFLAVGTDFTFGRGGTGNVSLLEAAAPGAGFSVSVLEKECYQGREISSSWVRAAVQKGDMELTAQLLGIPYSILGSIVEGQHLGRTIGFPTINCQPDTGKLLPPDGVYFSEATLGNGSEALTYPAITNIGYKPTVTDSGIMGIETHLCPLSHSMKPIDTILTSKEVIIHLLHYHRPEIKFDNIQTLTTQITKDVKARENFPCLPPYSTPLMYTAT
jgi:riboflavin kinase/FMN adenylyltransferase